MRLEPLLPVWVSLPVGVLLLGLCIWRILQVRHRQPLLLRWIRRGALVLALLLMALGPSVPGGTSAPGVANLDVIFAVDTTPSMGAIDYAGGGKRLDGVKQDLLALDKQLKGAHVALVTFDTQANLVLPFTSDSSTFGAAVATLVPQVSTYSSGSSIDLPISLIVQQLKDSKALNPERNRMVFYFGDGEQTADKPVKTFAPIASYISGGGVLGYGTASGAKMIKYTGTAYAQPDGSSNSAYILTPATTGSGLVPAISKLDTGALKLMASQMGVSYSNRDSGGSISQVFQASKAAYIIDHTKHISHYLNLYWLFAIIFSGLLFWEWKDIVLKLFALREEKEADNGK